MVGALPKAASRREIDITDSKLVIILAHLQEKIKLGDLPFVSLHHNIFLQNVLSSLYDSSQNKNSWSLLVKARSAL